VRLLAIFKSATKVDGSGLLKQVDGSSGDFDFDFVGEGCELTSPDANNYHHNCENIFLDLYLYLIML
jgi:hypothetical protein